MPTISGNDANVITINGQRLNAQGISRLRDNVTTEDAATKLKGGGFDEMIFSTTGADGKAQRLVAWGDKLDFSFRSKESIPDVRVNGQPANLLAFSNEPTTFWRGTLHGVIDGVRNAFDAIEGMAKNSIAGVAVASGAAMLGSTVWVVATRGAALELIKGAFLTFGPQLASAGLMLSGTAIGLVILAGAVKGGFGALNGQPKMEALAGVIDDSPPKINVAPAAPAANSRADKPTPQAVTQPAPQKQAAPKLTAQHPAAQKPGAPQRPVSQRPAAPAAQGKTPAKTPATPAAT